MWGIPPLLRDFQGAVGRGGNPASGFPRFPPPRHFHRSLCLWYFLCQRAGGNGDSILHCRSSLAFASPIFRAHSVSLIFSRSGPASQSFLRLEILSGFRQRLQLLVRCLVIGGLVVPCPFAARVEACCREPAGPVIVQIRIEVRRVASYVLNREQKYFNISGSLK